MRDQVIRMDEKICFILAGVLALCITTSCSTQTGEGRHCYPTFGLDDFESIEKNSISIQKWTPLETVNENLIGMDLRVKYNDSLYLIMDEATKDRIHVFDKTGKYRSSIADVGEGPNTLPSLKDFDFGANNEILVLSTVADKATVYRVSNSRELSVKFSLSYIADSFAFLENGDFLFYGGYNLPFVTHRIVQTSTDGIVRNRFLKNMYTNTMLPMTEMNFFPTDSGTFVLESFNPKIYIYRRDSLSVYLEANFGAFRIPTQFWELDIMEGFQMINKNGFANFRSIYYRKGLMLADVMIQKEQEVFKYILFEKGTERYKLEVNRDDDMLFYWPIGIDENDQMMFVTYKSVLDSQGPTLSNSLPSDSLTTSYYDYPIILHVTIPDLP